MEELRRVRRALARLAFCGAALLALPARADVPEAPTASAMEEARAHYAKGVQLYNDGSYEAALVELDRANKLAPSFRILYSMGLVQLRLNDFVGAKRSFETYLADGGAEVPAARQAEVNERLAQLASRIATVEIRVDTPDASVYVDDLSVGTAPLDKPIFVNPGYHKISATKAGYNGDAKQLGFAGGDKAQVTLQLTPIGPAAAAEAPGQAPIAVAPAPPPEGAAPRPSATPRAVWIGWTAAGVLAAGAVVTGIVALNQSSKLSSEVDNQPTAGADIASTHRRTVTFALVTDVLGGAALVAGGISLYLTLSTKKQSATTATATRLGFGPGRVELIGSF